MHCNSFSQIRPAPEYDHGNNITLGFEWATVFSAGQRKILWASVFLLWLFRAGSVEGTKVVITTGEKRKKRFMEKSERNDKEEEDHENSSGRHALTSVPCEAQHSF